MAYMWDQQHILATSALSHSSDSLELLISLVQNYLEKNGLYLAISPTLTCKARLLLPKVQSRSWDASYLPPQPLMRSSLKTSPKPDEHFLNLHMVWEISAHGLHWRTSGIAW